MCNIYFQSAGGARRFLVKEQQFFTERSDTLNIYTIYQDVTIL